MYWGSPCTDHWTKSFAALSQNNYLNYRENDDYHSNYVDEDREGVCLGLMYLRIA